MDKIRVSLAYKAVLAFFIALLPIIIVFLITYSSHKRHMEALVLENMNSIAAEREGDIILFLQISKDRMEDFASDGIIVEETERMIRTRPEGPRLSDYIETHKLPILKNIYRLSVISRDGKVLASTVRSVIGRDMSSEDFFIKGLKGTSAAERPRGLMDRPEIAVSSPIYSRRTGKVIGVMAGFSPASSIGRYLTGEHEEELGGTAHTVKGHKTLEAYLVNRDRLMLTESIFIKGPVGGIRVDTAPVAACLERGATSSGFWKDYRGVDVAGSSMCFRDFGWTLVVEIDKDEALAPLFYIKTYALGGGVVSVGVLSALVLFFMRNVIMQLSALAGGAKEVAQGNYRVRMPIRTQDELGVLTQSFNDMASRVQRREAEIRESEERLSAIMDNTSNVIYMKDLSGRYILINSTYERLFGISKEGIKGKTDHDIFPREAADRFRENDLSALSAQMPVSFEETAPHGDGDHYYISVKFGLRDSEGKLYAVCGISTDITELRKADEALRRSQRGLANAQRIAHVGNAEWDLVNNRIECSEEFYSILGIPRERQCPSFEGLFEAVHPEDKEFVRRHIEDAIRTGTTVPLDFRIISLDGKEKYVHAEAESKLDESGRPMLLYGTIQDVTEVRKKEEALRSSEESLANAQRIAHIGNWDWDIVNNTLYWSDEIYRIFGVPPREFGATYDAFLGYVHPEDREFVMKSVDDALYRKKNYSIDHRILLPDGVEKIVHEQAEATFNKEGMPVKMSGTVQDITEMRRLEEEQARLSTIIELSPDLIGIADPHGRMLYLNEAGRVLLGFGEHEDISGVNIYGVHPRWVQDILINEGFPTAAERGVWRGETAFVSRDGREIPASQVVMAHRSPSGKVMYFSTIASDISEIKKAEALLKESERKYRGLVDNALVGVYTADLKGEILFANRALAFIFEFGSPGELISEGTWARFRNTADREKFVDTLKALGKLENYELEVVTRTGKRRNILCTASLESGGEVYSGMVIDITKRKIAEEELKKLTGELEKRVEERTAELEEANRELESFSYSVAHDLRSPLRLIDGFSALVLKNYWESIDEHGRDHLARVRQACGRMTELIEDLLRFSQVLRAGIERREVDLTALAASIIEELRKNNPERQVEYVSDEGLIAQADPGLVKDVLENLLGNAWKFTSRTPGARIELRSAGKEGPKTIFCVRDNGVGFEMKYASEIFAPFHRLYRADEFPGTGIGLATVERIIRRHGGRVWAEGEPGRGAAFYFTL